MKKVIIIGTGGHAKVIADIILKNGDEIGGFFDPSIDKGKLFLGFPILGDENNDYQYYKNQGYCFFLGIGNNQMRKKMAERLDGPWYTAIHSSAIIAQDVEIGEGTCIMAGTVINSSTRIGKHCIVNTLSSMDHDNKMADFSHISPHVALAGKVSVGQLCHIGVGVSVIDGISICDEVTVGAGAVVIKDIKEPGVYIGVPAGKK